MQYFLALVIAVFVVWPIEVSADIGEVLPKFRAVEGEPKAILVSCSTQALVPDQDADRKPAKVSIAVGVRTLKRQTLGLVGAYHYSQGGPRSSIAFPSTIQRTALASNDGGSRSAILDGDMQLQLRWVRRIEGQHRDFAALIDNVRTELALSNLFRHGDSRNGSVTGPSVFLQSRVHQLHGVEADTCRHDGKKGHEPLGQTVSPPLAVIAANAGWIPIAAILMHGAAAWIGWWLAGRTIRRILNEDANHNGREQEPEKG